ncbi:DUF6573 family protein [Micromonospora echinospora]
MDIIHSYSRTRAIADGVLVDVTDTAKEAGFRIPVALTQAVWSDCVEWSDVDRQHTGAIQDEAGRLWDVLWMAMIAARRSSGSRTTYQLVRVPRDGSSIHPQMVDLVMVIDGGDTGEPVITIMQPDED